MTPDQRMGPESFEEQLNSWRRISETELGELQRSLRVQQQLRAVAESLSKRCDEIADGNEKIRAVQVQESPDWTRCKSLEEQVQELQFAVELAIERHTELEAQVAERRGRHAKMAGKEDALRQALAQAAMRSCDLQESELRAESRRQAANDEARSLVTRESLLRAERDALRERDRLCEQEAETARLRQTLADTWASRSLDEGLKVEDNLDSLKVLDGVEEELKWLSEMQREASNEVHRLQHLERTEASLHAKLKTASEEKASLQSARIDLGDAGNALREAIASQSEGYVRRVGGLEEARRTADVDRVKLITEIADLQARLDAMTPELATLSSVEGRYAKLEAERQALVVESQRLRDVNVALGAQLLGDDGPAMAGHDEGMAGITEAVSRVLQLQLRLIERQEAQDAERQKLAERIRALEREASQPEALPAKTSGFGRGKQKEGSGAPSSGVSETQSALASATSMLRGGFSRLRDRLSDAALDVALR